MATLFVLLAAIIGAYAFVTDAHRVKAMAEGYLSGLLGGRVEVGRATLSIFQGLRLDDVNVYAVGSNKDDEEHALFSADSFLIEYNPATLLSGKLAATQIKVVDPRVHLTENIDTGQWSFQKLNPRRPSPTTPKVGDRPPVLPELLLRNATVEYSQVSSNGEGPTNSITLEGQFIPGLEPDTYHFLLQSRGVVEGVGPSVQGTLVMGTNQVQAKLSNFVVGPDVKAMLPAEVRKWVEDHQVAGALDADVNYRPKDPEHRFRVQMDLGGVTATVNPAEWMSVAEVRRLELAQRSMGVLYLAGLNTLIAGAGNESFVDHLDSMLSPTPLRLDGVAGQFIFTQDGIDIVAGRGRVESNGFRVEGHIGGYNPTATIHLRITSPQTENLYVPPAPRYVSSMPGPVRDVYNRFKPQGICSFWADINRAVPGGAPQVSGELSILDGQFSYEKFSYPVQHVTGKIIVATNENGEPSMRMEHVRGHGVDGGPNASADFEINGWMAPLGPEVEIHMDISGQNVSNEPLLTAALPSGAQTAMRMFDAPGRGEFPKYRGHFDVQVQRDRGRKSHWTIATDIHVDDAAGSFAAFPYPLDHVIADVHIQGDRLDISNATMHRGQASLAMDGNVTWGSGVADSGGGFVPATDHRADEPSTVKPHLRISAKTVPIDQTLLSALPPERRSWLEKVGVGGTIDANGTIAAPREAISAEGQTAPLDLNLNIDWHDGTMTPMEGNVLASDITGKLVVQPEKLTISDLRGMRGGSAISASGSVNLLTDPPEVNFKGAASNLLLDEKLYALLPDAARKGWNAVHPDGTVDVTVQYSGSVGSATSQVPTTGPTHALIHAPSAARALPPPGYQITLTPRALSATLAAVPYKLDHLEGGLVIQPDLIEIKDLVGHHGDATVRASGSGIADAWDLHLNAQQMLIDDDFRHAAPVSLANLLRSLAMQGKIKFDFSKLTLTPASAHPSSTSAPAVAVADVPSDIHFAVQVSTDDGSLNVGVPLDHVKGTANLEGDTTGGTLHQLTGGVEAESLSLADRSLSDLHVELLKPADNDLLQIKKLQARIADGQLAGQMEWAFPDKGPSRYAVAMIVQNADVKQLTGEKTADVHGRLSASLNVEGDTNAPQTRRGRGDVAVTGSDMYHIPLVLGLLQVTNLALPITSPFSEATARYSIEGERVTFEQIELRAREMMMQGSGHLDFDTKRVKMTFTTDNTTWPKLPIIGDLLTSARHELLQIHVNGTLQDPKVSASAMNTFTTTIDQVFKGSETDSETNRRDRGGY